MFIGGAAVAAAAAWFGWPVVERMLPRDFAFELYDHPKGFRRFSAGQMSGDSSVLFGLEANSAPSPTRADQAVRADLCSTLFGLEPLPPGVLPIASFSDYNCPYCRILSDILLELEVRFRGRVRITWHEWPALGASSRTMARAALAARRQGAYEEFHRTLMRSRFVPSREYLRELAKAKGIKPDVMFADMRSPEVAWEIAIGTALAKMFGFLGTPALVVGRTAVTGAVGKSTLEALIELERREGPVPGCG